MPAPDPAPSLVAPQLPPHRVPPPPSWRKPAGMLGLLLYITVYAVVAARLGGMLNDLPTLLTVVGWAALGLAWLLPLRPLLLWMSTGRWKDQA
jgi:hypothetical protein